MIYALLSIGVNRTPNATTLKHAEHDAVRFGLGVTGANGAIPPGAAKYLVGNVTANDLEKALKSLARMRPEFLMIYFGGHGNAAGIALSDGVYGYVRLRNHLTAIGAHATVVVLDCCEAASIFKKSAAVVSGLGGLEPVTASWAGRLLSVEPGVRVFAAADRGKNTYDGWFVDALLNAMFDTGDGDLYDVEGTELVSDLLVFRRTEEIMLSKGVAPQAFGIFGDFPLMLANNVPTGRVILTVTPATNLGVIVDAVACERRYLRTTIVATSTDPYGNVLPPASVVFASTDDATARRARFEVDRGLSPGCQQELFQRGACRVVWHVVALDDDGRVVGRSRKVADYYDTNHSTRWSHR